MKSSDEEYLDSLLNSAKTNNNPQSALSRMSSKSNNVNSGEILETESENLDALIDNSTGNEGIREIGELMDKADKDELIDDALASLLDDIQKPSDAGIPSFTVGNEPSGEDVRDAEEIALDEAIADAEKTDADIQRGGNESGEAPQEELVIPDIPEPLPIIDDSEIVDALAEMAPEVDLPEENSLITEKESDADQTPEEILTDLLDDMPGGNLMDSQEGHESSLSDIIDRERSAEEEAAQNDDNGLDLQSLDNMSIDEPQEAQPESEDVREESVANDDISLDDISLQEPGGEEVSDMPEVNGTVEEDSLSELESLLNMAEPATEESPETEENPQPEENAAEAEEGGIEDVGEAPAVPEAEAPSDTEELNVTATELGFIEEDDEHHAPVSLDEISEDDINLNDLEANLDELLGGIDETYETTEGEVAKILGDEPQEISTEEIMQDSEDVSIPDLDALMNSLANDEVESLEDTAHLDKELGPQEEELQKEDILDALTESGFDDLGTDVALDAISALPPMDENEEVDTGDSKSHGKHKKHKEGFFQRLFRALTEEDEDFENIGTEGLAGLTDENQQVLSELGEVEVKKKPKKEKKKKEKAKKPPKEKKPKKEKPPKEKKEKKPKPPKDPGVPEKAIAPRKVIISGLFAASLGILVCIPALILPVRIATERAKTAYSHNDYAKTYKLLHGKTLTSEQNTMYERARVLAWVDRYMKGYENYKAMNKEVEALDMLLMSERNKQNLLDEATKFNVEIQVRSVYDSIESLLSENYGLSEEDINEINSIKKDRDYTIRIMEVLGMFEE